MVSGGLLLFIFLVAIAFIIVMTAKVRMNAFLVLILAAFGVGLASGMEPVEVIKTVTGGFGGILGYIGIVIIAGTIIGTVLEKSHATLTMANTVLKAIGKTRSALAMSITGAIVSISVFCDSGFVILSSLNKTLAKKANISMTTMAIALSTGLMATHIFVPPTPGPIAAAANLDADLGLVIMFGIMISIPAVISGYLWAKWIGKKYYIEPDVQLDTEEKSVKLPKVFDSFAPIVAPILLITFRSIADFPNHPFGEGRAKVFFDFFGDPTVALIIGVFLAFRLLPKWTGEYLDGWVGEGMRNAASIIMITGAGGAFGTMLKATPIADYLSMSLAHYQLGIFLPFIISASLKTAQGSATVCLITTSALLAPLLPDLGLDSEMGRVLTVMAIGSGSLIVSHANDSYFWVVSQFSGIDASLMYKTQTMATLIQGLVTMTCIFFLSLVVL